MTEEEFDKLLGESIELKILKLIKFDRKILKCYNNRQLTERREEMIKNLKKVFPITIPILISFLFIGLSFGIYTSSFGYDFWMSPLTSVVIFSGSIQFVVVEATHSAMHLLSFILIVAMMNIRHFFYALTCLGKFKNLSRKEKTYAYYALCDEAYSMIMGAEVPNDMKKEDFYLSILILLQSYWFIGTVLGGILGNFINFEIKGIDFILTALFLVIFLSQWKQNRDHFPAIIGLLASVVAMLIFGKNFILPAMVIILFVLYVDYRRDKHD